MSKNEKLRGRQREFLLVISNSCADSAAAISVDAECDATRETVLDDERAKLLRRRLISELRDLGC